VPVETCMIVACCLCHCLRWHCFWPAWYGAGISTATLEGTSQAQIISARRCLFLHSVRRSHVAVLCTTYNVDRIMMQLQLQWVLAVRAPIWPAPASHAVRPTKQLCVALLMLGLAWEH
jgi:hypothetical protein